LTVAVSNGVPAALSAALVELGDSGLAGTFLGDLDPAVLTMLMTTATLVAAARGARLFSAPTLTPRVAIVLEGTIRAFLTGPLSRQLTIRYARAGSVISTASGLGGNQLSVSLQAMTPAVLIELDFGQLSDLFRDRPEVALAASAETSRRLEQVYRATATHAFATIPERVATHLLEMAESADGTFAVLVPQHILADAVGTTREVVARSLAEFRREGLIKTERERIVVQDPAGLAVRAGGWWTRTSLYAIDAAKATPSDFDLSPHAVVGVDSIKDIIYSNAASERVFGWPVGDMLGWPLDRLLGASGPGTLATAFGRPGAEAMGRPIGLGQTLLGHRSDGTEFPAEVTLVGATPAGASFVTIVDVSYRQRVRDLIARAAG
jgi:CRP/FNR family transcriptional regulator